MFKCLQILFLGSGDLRNALLTASQLTEAYPELNIHLNDDHDIVTARNVLFVHIILSNDNDSQNSADINYLKNVDLLSTKWAVNLEIDASGVKKLNKILLHWLDIVNGTEISLENIWTILAKR